MSKFSGRICKIRSMSLDTNVISDIPALSYYETLLQGGLFLEEGEKTHYQRCRSSKKALFILLDFDVRPIGLPIVRKELSVAVPNLRSLYDCLFNVHAPVDNESKALADKYGSALALEPADATVLALACHARVDVLLSWNRHHISRKSTRETLESINAGLHLPTPEILTPDEFLARVMKTEKKAIALSPAPLREIYRVQSYLSKRGI